ncbi:alpha-hydroxy-acid oxidizing protein [Cupriavidus sp. CuC1]|uniref:alpha-hydroxy-acid oxidizing protein n=1 Tax=Cupriavidus sp. CuC1 TaxID=3373131 RepID=UPI0037D58203
MTRSKLSRKPGDGDAFFRLYTPNDLDLAASFVRRAEAAGYKGIVVTLYTWHTGWREGPQRQQLSPVARRRSGELLSNLHFHTKLAVRRKTMSPQSCGIGHPSSG